VKIALICFAVIALMGAVLFTHIRNKNIAARREAFAVLDQQKQAYEQLLTVGTAVSNVSDIAGRAESLLVTASNLVTEALGAVAFPAPKSTPAPASGSTGPGASAGGNPGGLLTREQLEARRTAETGGGAQPEAVRPPPPPPRPTPPIEQPKLRASEENPAGLMSREELDRQRAGKDEPKPPPAPPPKAPAPPPPSAPVPPPPISPLPSLTPTPPVPDKDAPIKVTYRRVESCLIRLREMDRTAFEIDAQARTLYEDILTDRTLSNALLRVQAIAPLADKAAGMHKEALDLLQQTKDRVDDVRREMARVEEDHAIAAEAERKRREEEALRILIASEIKRAKVLRTEQTPKVQKWAFARLLEEATSAQEAMKTPEGKKAVEPLIDRASRLKAFHQFLVDQIGKTPYKWGWGEGGAARDIEAATLDGIKYTGGTAPWPEISARQLIKIIDHYLADVRLGGRTIGDAYLAASLLFRDMNAGEPADIYARKAVQYAPSLGDEIIRLR